MPDALENPLIGPDAVELVSKGVAIVVATRDDELRPTVTRAWGPQVSADRRSVTACVGVGGPISPLANLERRSEIAATFTLPTSYRSIQMKGVVVDVSEPTGEQMRVAEEHFGAFSREALQMGVPPRGVDRFFDPGPYVAVTFAVHELYDQTPGPTAGSRW